MAETTDTSQRVATKKGGPTTNPSPTPSFEIGPDQEREASSTPKTHNLETMMLAFMMLKVADWSVHMSAADQPSFLALETISSN